jgi:hypothetical protein
MSKHQKEYCEGKDSGNKIYCLHQIYLTGKDVTSTTLIDLSTCIFVYIPTDLEVAHTNTIRSLILPNSFYDAIQYMSGEQFVLQ